jgi:glycosyltransferase involved in cell wall biosynthesis
MISIITPVFNSEKYIESCLKSVASQYFEGLEHLIVDGGSTDGTVEIIKKFASENKYVKWISERDNGQSHAMNKGISLASNPVISFLNADDRYEPQALSFVKSFFETQTKINFLVGDCRVLKEDGSEYMINKPFPFDPVSFIMDYNFPYNPSAYFYQKSLHSTVGSYDEKDHLTMDIDFLFRILPVANIQYVGRILGNYVMVANSKTMKEISAGRNVENLLSIFEKYEVQLSLMQSARLRFHRILGKNRGWIIYYLDNPLRLFSAFFKKSKG